MAAAACVLASGLLVGGSCASLAFAEPDQGQSGDTTGEPPSGAPGTSAPRPSGTTAPEPTTEAPKTGVTAPEGTGAPTEKPVTQVGDGRNGLPVGETSASTAPATPSKHSEAESEAPPQTKAPDSSEQPGATTAATKDTTEALPTGTTTAPTIDPEAKLAVEPTVDPTSEETTTPSAEPTKTEEPEHPGWPFPCWWPIPDPGNPPGGGGGGGGGAEPPIGHPAPVPPPMQLPFPLPQVPELPGIPFEPIIDAVNGLATAAAQLPFVPISLPVIVVPSLGVPGAGAAGGGSGGAGAGGVGGPGVGPRPGGTVPPPVTGRTGGKPATSPAEPKPSSPPAFSAGSGSAPAPSYRAGYVDYLRAAGLGQVAAVAVPGVTGILILTGAGGLLGYRQARAGHTVRASGTGRFMG